MEPLKIGIIGAGSRGIYCFGDTFKERADCQVVALADTNQPRMEAARRYLKLPDIRLYPTAEEMVSTEKLDAVIVTSPDRFHAQHTIAALRAGCNVLSDKPLATKVKDCLEIARVSRETGKYVDMGFNLRHETVCKKIKELVDSGIIGNIQVIDNRDYYYGGRTYFSRWNRHFAVSGGLFCHKGSHDFDLLNWYNCGGLPARVSAFAGIDVIRHDKLPFQLAAGEKPGPCCEVCQVAHKCPDKYDVTGSDMWTGAARAADGYNKDECMFISDKDTHDNGIAIVEYDNGVRASHWECFFTPVSGRRFTIIGDRGHLDAELSTDLISVYPRWTQDRIDYKMGRPVGGHGGADPTMVDTFVKNLRAGARPVASVRDGTLSVAVAEAAETARRQNRTVEISELLTRHDLDLLA